MDTLHVNRKFLFDINLNKYLLIVPKALYVFRHNYILVCPLFFISFFINWTVFLIVIFQGSLQRRNTLFLFRNIGKINKQDGMNSGLTSITFAIALLVFIVLIENYLVNCNQDHSGLNTDKFNVGDKIKLKYDHLEFIDKNLYAHLASEIGASLDWTQFYKRL